MMDKLNKYAYTREDLYLAKNSLARLTRPQQMEIQKGIPWCGD